MNDSHLFFFSTRIICVSILSLWCLISTVQAQFWSVKTPPPLPFQIVDTFPDADALILLEKGSISPSFEGLKITYFVRIIVLKELGVKQSNVNLRYYSEGGEQNILAPLGRTWNWDGEQYQMTEMKRKDFLREKEDGEVSVLSFALPQVKVGSVFDYQYELTKKSAFSYTWTFQNWLPTLRSELEFFKNDEMAYYQVFQNGLNVELNTMPDSDLSWYIENLPAVKEEAFVNNPTDFSPKLLFQLAAYATGGRIEKVLLGWDDFTKDLYDRKLLGRYLKKEKELSAISSALCIGAETEQEKLQRIYTYVQQKVNWNGERDIFARKKVKDIYEAKEGSSADINILLVHLLREAAFEAYPMFVSTRDHGLPIEKFPLLNQFNTTLCYVLLDEKPMVLDAVNALRPYHLLAKNDLNRQGWVLEKGNGRWEAIPPPSRTNLTVIAQLKMDEAGELKGTLTENSTGFKALGTRSRIIQEDQESFIQSYQSENLPEGTINSYTISHLDSAEAPLMVSLEIESTDFAVQSEEYIYLNPLLMMQWESNPFSESQRMYPVDLVYPQSASGTILIDFPDTYEVESLPKPSSMKLPGNAMRFAYQIQQLPGSSVLQVQYQFGINQTLYPPQEYPNLKLMYDEIMAKHNEQIVLRKR